MNERIRQLALEAGAGEWGDSVVPAMMDIEKFADLIVRDCAEICLEANDHDNILRYFGVEK